MDTNNNRGKDFYVVLVVIIVVVAMAAVWWFFRPTSLTAPSGDSTIQNDLNQIKVDDINGEFNQIDKDLQGL